MTPSNSPQPFHLGPVSAKGSTPALEKDPFTGLAFPAPPPPPKPVVPPDVMLLGPSAEPPQLTPFGMPTVPPMPPPRFEKPEVNPAKFMPAPRKKGLSRAM